MKQVKLWYLAGYPGHYFETKLAAEVEARRVFPPEDYSVEQGYIRTRYSRVFHRVFYTEENGK